jgi:hypothetical protein
MRTVTRQYGCHSTRVAPVLAAVLLAAGLAFPASSLAQDPASETASGTSQPLEIEVFHLIFRVVEPGLYEVAQVMSVVNTSDAPYQAGPEVEGRGVAGLVIPVPAQAARINALPPPQGGLNPAALVLEDTRLLHLEPVAPGMHQIGISYEVVAGPEGEDVVFTLPYPTQRVSLLVGGPAGASVQVEAPQLVRQQPMELGAQGVFAQWSAESLPAGATVSFRIGPTPAPLSPKTLALISFCFALVVAITVSIYGGRRRQDLGIERQQVIEDIAHLDIASRSGQIDASDYLHQRGAALERLAALDEVSGLAEANSNSSAAEQGEPKAERGQSKR